MTNCTQLSLDFPRCQNRLVQANFDGGEITSDAGLLLLKKADRALGLTRALASCISDSRDRRRCQHSKLSLLRQRIFGIAAGYEDLNDHDSLRHDTLFQVIAGRDDRLASSATLCRFEKRASRELAVNMHARFVDNFIRSFDAPPKELVLDFDATDDLVHGTQEGRFFNGYYRNYCFLPLYVFCGEQLLVSYLRPSNKDPARHAWAILKLLVQRLRAQWPGVRIIFRADSGFCRHRMLNWCDTHGIHYIVGIAKNKRLLKFSTPYREMAEELCRQTGQRQRIFTSIRYAAKSWRYRRRVIVKAEHNPLGANPRFITTNLNDDSQALYEKLYCARGDMENRIKEQQLDLFADRTSCHHWWPNQLRLLLSSAAYILIEHMRRIGLRGTQLAKAQCATIRSKLFKVGAVVVKNTRRIRFQISSHFPFQKLFRLVAARLAPD